MARIIAAMLAAVFLLGAGPLFGEPVISAQTVMVFPFDSVGAGDGWIGKAIQQSLQVDAVRAGVSIALTNPAAMEGGANPITVAAKSGASLAITGSYQVAADQLRATGNLVDTQSGRVVGVISATGPTTQLFRIEDSLGAQLRSALVPNVPATQSAVDVSTAAPVYQPSYQPVEASSPPVIENYYSTPTVDYAPPFYYPTYYGYSWPGIYPGFYGSFPVIIGSRHHEFRGGFHDEHFRGGNFRVFNGESGLTGGLRGGGFQRGLAAPQSSPRSFGPATGFSRSFSPAFSGGASRGGFNGGGFNRGGRR